MPHATILKVRQPLAASANAHPVDVLNIKAALRALGHYEAPEWGLSEFPEPALFKAVQAFQRARGLKVDGVLKPDGETEDALGRSLSKHQADTALFDIAHTLQGMGRNGDTLLAHITFEEAALLDRVTDGGSVNPKTGLLEFWYDHEADAYGVGDRADNSGPDYGDRGDRGSDNNDKTGSDTLGSQDTLGGGASVTVTSDATPEAPDAPDDREADHRARRTVLTPDNDPSYSAGFFDKKVAEDETKERDRQIWGSQKYWSPNDPPPLADGYTKPSPAPSVVKHAGVFRKAMPHLKKAVSPKNLEKRIDEAVDGTMGPGPTDFDPGDGPMAPPSVSSRDNPKQWKEKESAPFNAFTQAAKPYAKAALRTYFAREKAKRLARDFLSMPISNNGSDPGSGFLLGAPGRRGRKFHWAK